MELNNFTAPAALVIIHPALFMHCQLQEAMTKLDDMMKLTGRVAWSSGGPRTYLVTVQEYRELINGVRSAPRGAAQ